MWMGARRSKLARVSILEHDDGYTRKTNEMKFPEGNTTDAWPVRLCNDLVNNV